jgi:5'-deoxynucleotidase YfbR-like HD superfamily hydrolase
VTGDIATPVKEKFKEAMTNNENNNGKATDIITQTEKELIKEFVNDAPKKVGEKMGSNNGGLNLLDKLSNNKVGEYVSLVKDCDLLALMLECLYEKEAGVIAPEMEITYHECYRELNNSEWSSVRRFLSLLSDHWLNFNELRNRI